jgi:hypothetical protein
VQLIPDEMAADEGGDQTLCGASRRKFHGCELGVAVDQVGIKTRHLQHRGQVGRNRTFTGAAFLAANEDTALCQHSFLPAKTPHPDMYTCVCLYTHVYTRQYEYSLAQTFSQAFSLFFTPLPFLPNLLHP